METFYVDPNVFLRYLLKDNSNLYSQAEVLFAKAKRGQIKLLVATIVIFEIDFVLNSVYKFSKEKIIMSIDSLLSTSYLSIDELDIFRQAINLYKISSNSFVDCFLLTKAKSQEVKLFTFDKKLSKLS